MVETRQFSHVTCISVIVGLS